ncbi:MAG: aminoacyl-tRNA hydrolase [Alkalispirochaeta sp.]|jgi:PTH1 family peptidyl-tRNA hydrolase
MNRTGNQVIRLITLLGNPGRQYERSRHNVAWLLTPELTTTPTERWKEKFHGRFLKEGDRVYLIPHTYMNRSGKSVQAAVKFFNFTPQELLVVHDDMETPFGSVELTFAGGHRGNNGVRSIAQSLGTPDFYRLRIGVGRPPAGRRPGDWILERFSPDEEARLPDIVASAVRIISTGLT